MCEIIFTGRPSDLDRNKKSAFLRRRVYEEMLYVAHGQMFMVDLACFGPRCAAPVSLHVVVRCGPRHTDRK